MSTIYTPPGHEVFYNFLNAIETNNLNTVDEALGDKFMIEDVNEFLDSIDYGFDHAVRVPDYLNNSLSPRLVYLDLDLAGLVRLIENFGRKDADDMVRAFVVIYESLSKDVIKNVEFLLDRSFTVSLFVSANIARALRQAEVIGQDRVLKDLNARVHTALHGFDYRLVQIP